jgi:cytochrome P450
MIEVPVLDLSSPDHPFYQDPYARLAELREQAPVLRVRYCGISAWLFTRAEDIVGVLTDPRLSNETRHAEPQNRGAAWLFGQEGTGLSRHLALLDPPDHTRLRRLVGGVFTARRIERLRPMVQQAADELLAGFLPRGEADLMAEFAWPLPAAVISEILAVPAPDRAAFLEWVHQILGPSATDPERIAEAFGSCAAYLVELVEAKRGALDAAGNDLLTSLIVAEQDDERLTGEELRSVAFALLAAGFESTSLLIGNAMSALLRRPDQLATLRAQPELTAQAVEELLRYDTPIDSSLPRFAKQDLEISGVAIRKGQAVLCMLVSANRDLPLDGDSAELDLTRREVRHLSFGHGIHYCIGAPLARLQTQIALRTLLDRCQGIALAVKPDELVKEPGILTRRLAALPVTFAPRTP